MDAPNTKPRHIPKEIPSPILLKTVPNDTPKMIPIPVPIDRNKINNKLF